MNFHSMGANGNPWATPRTSLSEALCRFTTRSPLIYYFKDAHNLFVLNEAGAAHLEVMLPMQQPSTEG